MVQSILNIAVPYILAGLGGLFTEITGSLNIALEGQILTGAFWAIAVTRSTGNIFLGLAAAVISSTILSLINAFFSFRLKANIFISGLASNMLSYGMVSVFSVLFFGNSGIIRIGTDFVNLQYFFLILAALTAPAAHYALFKTPWGLRMRACGIAGDVLFYRGINPDFYKYSALLLSGALCGFSGAALAFGIGAFVPNISAGRGWIALVAVYLGYKKPAGVILSCLLFASAESLSSWMQGFIGVPATIILAIPYIITLAVLTTVSIIRKKALA
jgi:simple sugar transport system permease protein